MNRPIPLIGFVPSFAPELVREGNPFAQRLGHHELKVGARLRQRRPDFGKAGVVTNDSAAVRPLPDDKDP